MSGFSLPASPNVIGMPKLIPVVFGYEDLPLEEVLRLKDEFVFEDVGSLDDVTTIARQRLLALRFNGETFSSEQIRVWFLAYEFVFVKMGSILIAEVDPGDKTASIRFLSQYIHLVAAKYFSKMEERFSEKKGALDALFEFRRKKDGFESWVLEESVTCDVYDLITDIRRDEEAFEIYKQKKKQAPRRFTFT